MLKLMGEGDRWIAAAMEVHRELGPGLTTHIFAGEYPEAVVWAERGARAPGRHRERRSANGRA